METALFTVRAPYNPAFVARARGRSPATVASVGKARGRVGASHIPGTVDVPAAPGALVSVSDIRQYIAAVDQSVQDLDNDRFANLVWNDPDTLDEKAKLFDATWPEQAAKLRADAVTLRARAAGRPDDQVSKEEDWSSGWLDLLGRWNAIKTYVGYPDKMNATATGQWYKVHDLHTEINIAYDTYTHLGYTPTSAKKEGVVPSLIPGGDAVASWIPWAVGGALALIAVKVVFF